MAFCSELRRAAPNHEILFAHTLDEACLQIQYADVLTTFSAMAKADLYKNAARLKWVHALGAGLDNITNVPDLYNRVYVTATPGMYSRPMSEAAILMMLALLRDFPRSQEVQRARSWDRWPPKLLNGRTVGILGVGKTAEALAPLCKLFGTAVVGISRTARIVEGFDRIVSREALTFILAEIDILVLLASLDESTKSIIDGEILKKMKPTSYLVNLARGGLVDDDALVEALHKGYISGAALDVFQQEPLPPESPLWDAPNLIITTHLGGFSENFLDYTLLPFLKNLKAFEGGRPEEMANIEHRPA
jgi:D-2-hydroxyacid dehydrogenase (NADP+)